MPRPQWLYGRHPPACTCVRCNKRRLDQRSGVAHSGESPGQGPIGGQRDFSSRRRSRRVRQAFWRLATGLLWLAIVGLVALTGGLIGIHWYQSAPFDTSVRMMIDDYRVAVACPREYEVIVDFVDRSVLDTTLLKLAGIQGDDWVQEVCNGAQVAQATAPVSPSSTLTPTAPTDTLSTTPTAKGIPAPEQQVRRAASTAATTTVVTSPPSPTSTSSATTSNSRREPPLDEVAPLRQFAIDLVNQRRRQLGLPVLVLGDSVAAQLHAEQSLDRLELLRVTEEGLPPEALYTAHGGRGYISWSGQIGGYWPESSVIQCGSRQVICERVVPDIKVATYVRSRLDVDMADGGEGVLSPVWSTMHMGIALTDWTLVIVQFLERQGLDYVQEPIIRGGFLSLEVIPRSEQNIELVQVYRHQPLADVPNEGRVTETKVLEIFEPPPPGHSTELPSDISVAADYWFDDGESVKIVVALEGRLPGPGIYEIVIWTEKDIPASQYFIRVDDPTDLELDLLARPFDQPERPSLESLRLFALDMINVDRDKHGVPPVRLGANASAQIHAEDAIASGYLVGHWTADGRKPYMLYRQADGTGIVAENAAGSGRANIAGHQWGMMYDDAHADWGHRDTIISPNYDTVNIGIAFDDHRLAFYQHFEYNGLAYVEEPVLDGGLLRLHPRPLGGHAIGNIAVYYDPSPTPKSPSEIELLTSYCTGGGFTDDCGDVRPIAFVLKPPPPSSSYGDLKPDRVVARMWNELGDGSVEIEACLGPLADRPGVYTVVVWSASEDSRRLSQYSIFK